MAVRREQVIRTAEKYVSKGRIDSAIKEYRKVLDKHPNDVNTLNRLGDLYARVQRYDEAVSLFERLAGGYTDDGFFVKAIAIYKKIIKLDPTRLEIYERLADLYHKQGLINEARTQYQVLADYYTKHDNPTSAIKVYREMSELEPDNLSHHAKLAELYAEQKLVEKAMTEYATIAELMIEHGHPDEATQVYKKALDVDPSDIDFITAAATTLKDAGHIAEAARFLAIATERNPDARGVAQQVGMEKQPEPEPEAPPEPEAAAAVAPAAPEAEETLTEEALEPPPPTDAAETGAAETEESSVDLALDLDDTDLGAAEAEPEVAAEEAATEDLAADEEIELDLEDAFVLDLEDEEPSPSQVQPPPDMMDGRPARAFQPEEEAEVPEAAGGPTPEAPVEEAPVEEPPAAQVPTAQAPAEPPPWEASPVEEPSAVHEPPAPSGPAEESGVHPPPVESGERVEVDPEILERTVSDLEPEVVQRDEDELVSEAEVLAKYNMTDKAIERLRQALSMDPHHMEAHEVLLKVHLDEGENGEIPRLAARMARAAEAVGDADRWPRMRQRLERAGYRFEETEPEAPPAPPPQQKKASSEERVNRLLEDLLGDTLPRRKKPPKPAETSPLEPPPPEAAEAEELVEPVEGTAEPPPPEAIEEAPVIEEPPLPDPDDITLHGIFDEVEVDDGTLPSAPGAGAEPAPPDAMSPDEVSDEMPAAPDLEPEIPPSPVEPAAEASSMELESAELEDSSTSWLDEVEAEPAASAEADVFKEEDGFFDLAGELEDELSKEEALDPEGMVQPKEQTLEEIVEGFKQGVAENLSPEDYDTHFNLGIAYREMGLLDEAIGEFQVASKSRRHLVECCSMLGLSFLDKGLPELAIKWYRQGLETPDLTEEETLGLLYDMGNLYVDMEDHEAAHKTFVEIYGINSNYRDVVAKLEELKQA